GKRFFYGWYIVASGALSNILMFGVTSFGFGAMYHAMREEMGWSMAAITAGVSIRSLENGFLSPVTGYMIDRLGPRRTSLLGIAIVSGGLLMFSQAHSIGVYYLATMVVALGQSLGSVQAYGYAIVKWFVRKRGLAM